MVSDATGFTVGMWTSRLDAEILVRGGSFRSSITLVDDGKTPIHLKTIKREARKEILANLRSEYVKMDDKFRRHFVIEIELDPDYPDYMDLGPIFPTDATVTPGSMFTITQQNSEDLNQHINSMDEQKISSFEVQLVPALEHLHELGFTHGDVKPENILINIDSNIFQFIDFEFSIQNNLEYEWNFLQGTQTFLCPLMPSEHKRLKTLNAANIKKNPMTREFEDCKLADWFAFGVTKWCLQQKKRPWWFVCGLRPSIIQHTKQLEQNRTLILENGPKMEYVDRWVTKVQFPNLWHTVVEQIQDLAQDLA
jgi:serine/threonine protein kinase